MLKIKTFAAILFAVLFGIQAQATSQVSNPNGNLQKLSPDDIWAKTMTGSHFNEFWTYQFYLNDNLNVHITFSVANFGSLKSPVSGVQVSVDRMGGELYQLSREYSIEHLVQDRENYIFQNRIDRELYFKGKTSESINVRINTSKDGVNYDIDLTLFDIEQGYKWGNGKYTIGNEQVGIYTHIPYARVNGYVEVNNKRKQVSGSAYMDQTFQNQTTTGLVQSGYRFVHHEDADNWDILYMLLPDNSDNKKTVGHLLAKQDGIPKVQGIRNIESMSSRDTFGEQLARVLDINLDNGTSIRLTRRNDTEKFSVLSELGRIARRAARTFLGGEVIHFRGEAVLLETGQRPKRGGYNFLIVT